MRQLLLAARAALLPLFVLLLLCGAARAQTFAPTGTLTEARYSHTATLLPDGTVLLAGGDANANLLSAELYNSTTKTFTATASPTKVGHGNPTATLLPDGTVLLAGGSDGNFNALSSAELYNPTTKTFTTTGNMTTARDLHTATLLPDGTVLLAGGRDSTVNALSSAELYNPTTKTFTATATMTTARASHTATLLPDGTVLLAGGSDGNFNALSSAELYNPTTKTFTATGTLTEARYSHTATLLPDGTVLLAGGVGRGGGSSSAELYNPTSKTFTATGIMTTARQRHTATLLKGGTVLLAGGANTEGTLSSAELYNPTSKTFTATGVMTTARQRHTATLLPDGTTLLAGGQNDSSGASSSAELYTPAPAPTPIPTSTPGPVDTSGALISQFRFNGPRGGSDQFVELANVTNAPLNVTGWSLSAGPPNAAATVTIPITGVIPANGHLLLTDSGPAPAPTATPAPNATPTTPPPPPKPVGYSLGVPGDITYTTNIPQGDTLTLTNAQGTVVDFVSSLHAPPVYSDQYAFVRRLNTGAPSNYGDTQYDWNLVDTTSTYSTTDRSGVSTFDVGPQGTGRLGSPNPHNSQSTVQHNAGIRNAPLNMAGVYPVARYASKNSDVDPLGRLSIRRTITNQTGHNVSKLRFRIVAITAGTSDDSTVADLRAISSVGAKNPNTLQTVTLGLNIDAPTKPDMPLTNTSTGNGGGLNAGWTTPLPGGTLAVGASVNVEFLFGIQAEGNFRVLVDAELLP